MKTIVGASLIFLLAAAQSVAQDLDGTLKSIKASSTFRLGYLETAPPFSFPGPDKRPVGYQSISVLRLQALFRNSSGLISSSNGCL